MDIELLRRIKETGSNGYAIQNEHDSCCNLEDLNNHFKLNFAGLITVKIYRVGHSWYRRCYITGLGVKKLIDSKRNGVNMTTNEQILNSSLGVPSERFSSAITEMENEILVNLSDLERGEGKRKWYIAKQTGIVTHLMAFYSNVLSTVILNP